MPFADLFATAPPAIQTLIPELLEHKARTAESERMERLPELDAFLHDFLENPNALELLAMPEDCIRHKHRLCELLKPEIFLSKLCAKTFGEYAMGQIRKARGLNKKIVNPQPEKRLSLLDFCNVPDGQGSVPVLRWLSDRKIGHRKCGLTSVQHTAGLFAIYHDPDASYRGLVSAKDPDALIFASVTKEAEPIGWMQFNQDAFRAHCKAHREYWEWVGQRNEERFLTNAQPGRGYDSKNLLHTSRLLEMAGEIARGGVLRIRRPNRGFLLSVRAWEFAYEDLVRHAEEQLAEVTADFGASKLQDQPDREQVDRLLVEIREAF